MQKHLKIDRIEFKSPEWYAYRSGGIGASDVPIVMSMLPYRPTKMELFHYKIGTEPLPMNENEAMFWGTENEDVVADMWQYWDGTDFGYINHKNNDVKQRKNRCLNGIIRNPKYPWLFGDVDRLANVGSARLDTGEEMQHEFPVECKNISHWAANMWQHGIPHYHIIQITTYMMLLDVEYGEIATLKDGRHYEVLPVELNPKIAEGIKKATNDFWYDKIIPGKALVAELRATKNAKKRRDIQGKIQALEPQPDANPAYHEYLSERFRKEDEMMQGDYRQYRLAHGLADLKRYTKEIENIEVEMKNYLRSEFVRNKVEKIDFDDEGYVRYYMRVNGKNHTLDNRIKPGKETPFDELSFQRLKAILSKWKKDYA